MPNAILLPRQIDSLRTKIPALINVVHGYPETEHKIGTNIGSAPLEEGAPVNDHASVKPTELTLSGWVSNLASSPSPTEEVFEEDAGGGTARGRNAGLIAWNAILFLHQEEEPVRVITGLQTYNEMMITECVARQRGIGGMTFQMKLKEVIRVGVLGARTIVATDGPAAGRTEEVVRGFILPMTPEGALEETAGFDTDDFDLVLEV